MFIELEKFDEQSSCEFLCPMDVLKLHLSDYGKEVYKQKDRIGLFRLGDILNLKDTSGKAKSILLFSLQKYLLAVSYNETLTGLMLTKLHHTTQLFIQEKTKEVDSKTEAVGNSFKMGSC